MKPTSQGTAFCMKPYECRPTPSMFTPNQEKLVTTLPKIAMIMSPRCRINPPQRACKMIAHQSTISTAPFSFGSQPQKRPHDWSAQIPPRTVPIKLKREAKQTTPYVIRDRESAVAFFSERVKTPRKM